MHRSVTSHPFRKSWRTDRQRQTDQPTDENEGSGSYTSNIKLRRHYEEEPCYRSDRHVWVCEGVREGVGEMCQRLLSIYKYKTENLNVSLMIQRRLSTLIILKLIKNDFLKIPILKLFSIHNSDSWCWRQLSEGGRGKANRFQGMKRNRVLKYCMSLLHPE